MTSSTGYRILLVEDDEDTRHLLAVALAGQGYEVMQAADARQGRQCLERSPIDMVVTDYDLPGKTGAAMLREANGAGLLDGVATLVVTAHPDPEPFATTTVMRKPLDLEKFMLQVRRILDARASAPETAGASARGGSEPAPEGAGRAAPIELRLYVSASSPASVKARRNMERLLGDSTAAHIDFHVVDVALEPERAEREYVVFTPTLVKRGAGPPAWVLGDLSDPRVVADVLHMCGIEPQ